MVTINQENLREAAELIKTAYGDLSDLPEELQNTVANIYYNYSYISSQLKGDYAFPEMIARLGLDKGFEEFSRQAASTTAAVRHLPTMIQAMRDSSHPESYEAYTLLILAIFKYNIDGAQNCSAEQLKRTISERSTEEIPGLWKLMRYSRTAQI